MKAKKGIKLLMPREKAITILTERIAQGNQLLHNSSDNAIDIDSLNTKCKIWSDYNLQLLNNMFSDEQISEEYEATSVFNLMPISVHHDDIYAQIGRYKLKVSKKIECLQSILNRMELFVESSWINSNFLSKFDTLKIRWGKIWKNNWTIGITTSIIATVIVTMVLFVYRSVKNSQKPPKVETSTLSKVELSLPKSKVILTKSQEDTKMLSISKLSLMRIKPSVKEGNKIETKLTFICPLKDIGMVHVNVEVSNDIEIEGMSISPEKAYNIYKQDYATKNYKGLEFKLLAGIDKFEIILITNKDPGQSLKVSYDSN